MNKRPPSGGSADSASGSESAAGSKMGPKVDAFDIRRSDRLAKSQLNAITMLHENFVRNVASSLSAYLRTYLSMSLVGMEQLSYAEFIEQLPSTTCLACLGMKPFDGSAVLEINPSLAFPMIEIVLGGSGKTALETSREITEIEQMLLDGVIRIITNDLSEAWKTITPIDFSIQTLGTEPQFLQLMPATEPVVTVRIEMRIGDKPGFMNIALPYLTLKMMRQKFTQSPAARKADRSQDERRRVLESLLPARAAIDARLPLQSIQTRDLLALQAGDVLTFDVVADSPLELMLNGRAFFAGRMVRCGKKRAFAVTEKLG